MSQLEYGDYYKFAASAGIALLVAAALLPWAFLREPFDLFHEAAKIALLTPEAQDLIHKRQHLVDVIVKIVPWISTVLALVGAFLTGYGLLRWRARQVVRDRGEDLQNMSHAEVEQKARDDAESLGDQPVQLIQAIEPIQTLTTEALPPTNVYLAVEDAVMKRLAECYGSNVKRNQRLGSVEFDAIIRMGQSDRIILEVKYIRKGFRQGWLTESLSNLAARTQLYRSTFSQAARGVLLIVMGPESSPSLVSLIAEESEKMRNTRSSRFGDLRISTLQEAEIESTPCRELTSLLN
jgi:hypothetical protein